MAWNEKLYFRNERDFLSFYKTLSEEIKDKTTIYFRFSTTFIEWEHYQGQYFLAFNYGTCEKQYETFKRGVLSFGNIRLVTHQFPKLFFRLPYHFIITKAIQFRIVDQERWPVIYQNTEKILSWVEKNFFEQLSSSFRGEFEMSRFKSETDPTPSELKLMRKTTLFIIKVLFFRLICSGLCGQKSEWTSFLCENIYDPRLLILIFNFSVSEEKERF